MVFALLLVALIFILLGLRLSGKKEYDILQIDYSVAQETIKHLQHKNELLEKENEQLKKELDMAKTADKIAKTEKIPVKRGRKPKTVKK